MKLAPHTPIREKYNPRPTAAEKRFHLWLMQMPCEACGRDPCGIFHHLLSDAPTKRFRRDHELGLPLCDCCHKSLHMAGAENDWCDQFGFDAALQAIAYRAVGRRKGLI